MPEVDTVAPPVTGAEPAPAARPPKEGATKRKLGLGGWIAASWLILMVIVAIVAPMLVASPIDTGTRSLRACGDGSGLPIYEALNCRDREAVRNQRDSGSADGKLTHLTGVDSAGRDVFSRTLLGTRATLIIGVVSISLAVLIGGALGLVSGYFRRRVDTVVSTLFDVMIAFPPLILALLLVLNFAGDVDSRRVPGIIIALTIVATPILGRISRVSTLAWSQREFVTAARALGAKPFRIITREVLPNVAPAMMSIAMLGIGIAIATESGLSLIGLGVPDDTVSWGSVIAQGGADFRNFPHLVFVPSVPLVVTVCCLNFLGDALRRKFDVRESAL
ncbi:MAG: ABC transporter permease [Acidimicrobiales bacterium]